MSLSTHKVEVVPVKLNPHPSADRLEIVEVFGGYPCCVVKGQFQDGDLAAYIPPDSVVDVSRPEFAFLAKGEKKAHRVKCVKLRGVQSFGLLMPAPPGTQIGDDVAEHFGVIHYEPEMKGACTGGEAEQAPAALTWLSRYDIDALRRYSSVFEPGEQVQVTEKIHGANSRYAWADGRMWCGSRSEWKKEDPQSLWWRALTREMTAWCRDHPEHILYGEVYGNVQSLRYGLGNGVAFAAFDVLFPDGQFMAASALRGHLAAWSVPQVPLIGLVPFDFGLMAALAEGPSLVPGADHIREGVVVKPMVERYHQAVGRVILKIVGEGYLSAD